jgi:hypothetical protein
MIERREQRHTDRTMVAADNRATIGQGLEPTRVGGIVAYVGIAPHLHERALLSNDRARRQQRTQRIGCGSTTTMRRVT